MNTERRSAFKKIFAALLRFTGIGALAAEEKTASPEKTCNNVVTE